jgi:hypothetical protein
MSGAREDSLNLMVNEIGFRVTSVSLAAIPRLKYGTLAMIGPAWRRAMGEYHSPNRGKIVLPVGWAAG